MGLLNGLSSSAAAAIFSGLSAIHLASARQKTLNFALEIEKTHLSRQRSGLIQLKLVKAPLLLCLFEIHSHLR